MLFGVLVLFVNQSGGMYISRLGLDGGWEAVIVEGTKHHLELALRELEIQASLALQDVAEASMV